MNRQERIEKVRAALNVWSICGFMDDRSLAAALVDALAPDEPVRRFAVGDTVARDGIVLGRVHDFPEPGKVGLDDGDIYGADELRKVEPEPAFKVGDRVRVLDGSHDVEGVVRIDGKNRIFYVEWTTDNGTTAGDWFNEPEMERAAPATPPLDPAQAMAALYPRVGQMRLPGGGDQGIDGSGPDRSDNSGHG